MSRWEPNARARLMEAAMDLFVERGFDQTTVAEIAEQAGLTERTFFRHFTDKREVLFSGSAALHELLTKTIASAPKSTSPMDMVTLALEAAAPTFDDRRAFARRRQTLINTHAELRERELIKLASLAAAMGASLRARGVQEPTASLAAEAGIAVFKIAFERWVEDREKHDLAHHIHACLRVNAKLR